MKKVNYLFKNVLVLFVFISFFSHEAKAGGGGTPWMTSGNAIAIGDFLGTNNNQPLNFRTNGTNRMHPYTVFSCYCSPPVMSTTTH